MEMLMRDYEMISDLLRDENHTLTARPPNGDNKVNILVREENSEEDTEDTEDKETTQTDTDESGDEMRQAADYVEHVEVTSRFFCLILIFLVSGGF